MQRQPFFRVLAVTFLYAAPIAALIIWVSYWWTLRQREREYEADIVKAATHYRVDPLLVKAVIWRESRFKWDAHGKAGEIGLMQVMELTGQEWAEAERIRDFSAKKLWIPAQNIQAGSWYLAKCLRRYGNTDNPIPYALADYNAGRSQVLRWNKGRASTNSAVFLAQMDYPGTRRYAESIMDRYHYYQRHNKPTRLN